MGQRAPDATHASIRKFSSGKTESFRHDSQFNYENDFRPAESLWDRLLRWIGNHLLRPVFMNIPLTIWNLIEIAICIITVLLIVRYYLKGNRTGLFSDTEENRSPQLQIVSEDIRQVDFDAAIEQACKNGQYRTAIRFLYLKSLRLLSQHSLIDWKPHKTNDAYIKELRPTNMYPLFTELTALFNSAWYGRTEITAEVYHEIKDSFNRLHLHPELA
jgi:hypothetical protein